MEVRERFKTVKNCELIKKFPKGERIIDMRIFRGKVIVATTNGIYYIDNKKVKRLKVSRPK